MKGRCRIIIHIKGPDPNPGQYAPNREQQCAIDARCDLFVRDIPSVSLGSLLEYIGGHDHYAAAQAIKGMFPRKLGGASNQIVVELVRTLNVAGNRISEEAITNIAKEFVVIGEEAIPSHASKYIRARIEYRASMIQRGLDRRDPEAELKKIDRRIRAAAGALNREGKESKPRKPLTDAQKRARQGRRELNHLLKGLFA